MSTTRVRELKELTATLSIQSNTDLSSKDSNLNKLIHHKNDFNLFELIICQPHPVLSQTESMAIINFLIDACSSSTANKIFDLLSTHAKKDDNLKMSSYDPQLTSRFITLIINLKNHIEIEKLRTPLKNRSFQQFLMQQVDPLNFMKLLVYGILDKDDFKHFSWKRKEIV